MDSAVASSIVETDVPARLDRLPWGRFHTLVVAALGITWILDGLEVTLAGSVAGALKESPVLKFSNTDVGLAASAYVTGAVLGAILFGWLTDRLGRRRLFFITLAVYMAATVATGLSWNVASFVLFRFLTGAGIGGEYAAINSTIQELIPCRYRGWTDLAINGSFWVGAAMGAGGSVLLLNPQLLAVDVGWRLCFLIGAALCIVVFFMRLWLPESPRWLITHGRPEQAARVIEGIEQRFLRHGHRFPSEAPPRLSFQGRSHIPLGEVVESLFWVHRRRAAVGLSLMAAQAFFYNAIFFTYALVLTDFYGVPASGVGWYILPFAAGNFLGPLLLGRFFDTIGRKPMIAATYVLSGLLLALSGVLFQQGQLNATTQTIAWMVVFFFASAAASSAYLTVSETFPLEVRALAIAIFYAVGTGLGGIVGPLLFGALIETGSRGEVLIGYLIGAVLMIGAALVLLAWGVKAERRPLESVCRPLTLAE
ncbi:MAG TPA: MFS transporter [Dongiaceae bacterium]|nr:MFS transporter [Dongiaceae bacterium]